MDRGSTRYCVLEDSGTIETARFAGFAILPQTKLHSIHALSLIAEVVPVCDWPSLSLNPHLDTPQYTSIVTCRGRSSPRTKIRIGPLDRQRYICTMLIVAPDSQKVYWSHRSETQLPNLTVKEERRRWAVENPIHQSTNLPICQPEPHLPSVNLDAIDAKYDFSIFLMRSFSNIMKFSIYWQEQHLP